MLSSPELLIAGLFVLALTLVSIVDIALSNVNRISARRIPSLLGLVENREAILLSVHIFIQLLIVAGAVFLFGAFGRREIPYVAGMPGTIVMMFIILLVFRQLIPRLVASRSPETTLRYVLPLLRFAHFFMRPFSSVLLRVMNYFRRWEAEVEPDKEEEASEEEIQAFIDVGQEEGILESDEGEMIQSIVHFGDKVAREVMTPRTQIVAIDINSSVDKLIQLVLAKHRTRIPVFRDDLDNMEGFIHERDLLRAGQRGDKTESIRPMVKPVNFVPETKPVDDLMQEMRQRGDHMVLVIDEYGGVSGLITMKDLVEEIVGNIRDSAEGDGEMIVEESPGVFVIPGSLELSALESKLGFPLVEQTECTTVAGAVVELFGKLPAVGEKVEHRGTQIEVLDADRRRVHRLRLKVLATRRMTG